ncbi:MAG: 30S ribosomal protein S9 [Deltaproteobacteria bacterium]|nr:MAG: 30S ribosomal protein S9 [Deltaproteobacteria bacterium]
MSATRLYATGKRKSAIARVWLSEGSGDIKVNGRSVEDYFTMDVAREMIFQPLSVAECDNKFDFMIKVIGGGVSGQAGAVKHGISKALQEYDPELRGVLKKAGFLSRDARIKERKKYGQRGARARYQFSKR